VNITQGADVLKAIAEQIGETLCVLGESDGFKSNEHEKVLFEDIDFLNLIWCTNMWVMTRKDWIQLSMIPYEEGSQS